MFASSCRPCKPDQVPLGIGKVRNHELRSRIFNRAHHPLAAESLSFMQRSLRIPKRRRTPVGDFRGGQLNDLCHGSAWRQKIYRNNLSDLPKVRNMRDVFQEFAAHLASHLTGPGLRVPHLHD